MPDKWYILVDDKKRGPATLDQLKQMIAVGKLKPTDWIQKDGTGGWGVASAVKGLFPCDGSAPTTPCAPAAAAQAPTAGGPHPLLSAPASQPPFSPRYREKVAAARAFFRANPLPVLLGGGGTVFLASVCMCGAFLSSVGLDPGKSDRPDEQILANADKKEAADGQQAVQKQAEESAKEEGKKSTKEPAKEPVKEPAVKKAPAQEQKPAESARKKLVGKWVSGGGVAALLLAEEFTADGKYILYGKNDKGKVTSSSSLPYEWLDDNTIEIKGLGGLPDMKKGISFKGDELIITDETGKYATYWRVVGPDQPQPLGANLTPPNSAVKFNRSTATKAALKKAIADGRRDGILSPELNVFMPIWDYKKYMEVIGAPDTDSAFGDSRLWRYKCMDGSITFRVRVSGVIFFDEIQSQ